jgi:uncharacterized membrane protein
LAADGAKGTVASAIDGSSDTSASAHAGRPGSVIERLIYFSDAVFAIAITLLALELRMPQLPYGYTDAMVFDELRHLVPSLFGFALSFLILATFWLGHVRSFRAVERSNGPFFALNMVFLFLIALIPLPTSMISVAPALPSTAIVYALVVGAAGLVASLLWIYETRIAHLVSEAITPDLARRITIRTLVSPALLIGSIPVALWNPVVAELLWLTTFPLQLIVSRHFGIGRSMEAALRA